MPVPVTAPDSVSVGKLLFVIIVPETSGNVYVLFADRPIDVRVICLVASPIKLTACFPTVCNDQVSDGVLVEVVVI